ncbi:MAG TPA: holo-ACP synthase [Puia sp.]|nr:holo-ACP synthase [Puia sp.]
MITGIGIDMIEPERVAEKIGRESGFRELVFSKKEIEYCEAKANKFEHYAARFAAKEAFFKALGTGWANGTAFNEIEISHDDTGRPVLQLTGGTAETLIQLKNAKIFVSLSHLKANASALVIIEQ